MVDYDQLGTLANIFHHDFLYSKFMDKLRIFSCKKPLQDLALARGIYTLLENTEYQQICNRSFRIQVSDGNITPREAEEFKEEGLDRAFGLLALMTGESLNLN